MSAQPLEPPASASFQENVTAPIIEDIYRLLEASLRRFTELNVKENLDIEIEVLPDKHVCVAVLPKEDGYDSATNQGKWFDERAQIYMAALALGKLEGLSVAGPGKAGEIGFENDRMTIEFDSLGDLRMAVEAAKKRTLGLVKS